MKGMITPEDIAAIREEIFSSLHCALPGIVESYDSDTCTATVQPSVKVKDANMPLLRDVPVYFPGGYTFPVHEGDECLVVFADSCTDEWFESGGAEISSSGRKHALSDGFALVGFFSRNKSPGGADLSVMEDTLSRLSPGNFDWQYNVDANDFRTTGMYGLASGCSNVMGQNWGLLYVYAPRWDILYQTFANVSGFYWRLYNYNTSAGWSEWKRMTDPHGLTEAPLPTVSDLNSCIYAGCYLYDTTTTNRPSNYGLCQVIASADPNSVGKGWVMQLAVDTYVPNGIYMRKRINAGSWTAWTKLKDENAYMPTLLLDTGYTLTTTAQSFSCNWSSYKTLYICYGNYANICDSVTMPVSEFNETTSGRRAILTYGNGIAEVYKNGSNTVYIKTNVQLQYEKIRIWGVG